MRIGTPYQRHLQEREESEQFHAYFGVGFFLASASFFTQATTLRGRVISACMGLGGIAYSYYILYQKIYRENFR